jgi:hypothetical protein
MDGIVFASKAEMRRYAELKMLERSGAITSLELQPRFILQDPFIAYPLHTLGISNIAKTERPS